MSKYCTTACNTRNFARLLGVLCGRFKAFVLIAALAAIFVPAQAVRGQGECAAGWLPGQGLPGVDDWVRAMVVLPGGDVIVGGNFSTAGGVPAYSIARYNPTTGVWSELGLGISGYISGQISGHVKALAVLPDGDVIVGGYFYLLGVGPVRTSNIARYNPTTGIWSALGSGTSDRVNALAVLPGGDVIVGGAFSIAGGVGANGIARYNPTTGVWSALGLGISGYVYALSVLPSGDVIVGGSFNHAGGRRANNIARYNPTTGIWSALGLGISGYVYALSVLPGGDVIVGGEFTTAGGVRVNNIARYSPTTGIWSALGSGVGDLGPSTVRALAVLQGGDVLAGGDFTTAGGVAANRIARYNPATAIWSALGSGINTSHVKALVVVPGGDVLVSGAITSAGGMPANNIARYTFGNPSDIAGPGQSLGSDNTLTADDIIVFLNWFFASDTRADVAGSGQTTTPDGAFTADDIIIFLDGFFAGC